MEDGYPVVQRIRDNSPATVAGIRVGDILLKINGEQAGSEGKTVFPKLAALDTATFIFRRPNGHEYSVSLSKTAWSNNP
jgi:S1-C subfamily serine protease